MFQMKGAWSGDWREWCFLRNQNSWQRQVGRVQRVMNESLGYHAEDLELCFK